VIARNAVNTSLGKVHKSRIVEILARHGELRAHDFSFPISNETRAEEFYEYAVS